MRAQDEGREADADDLADTLSAAELDRLAIRLRNLADYAAETQSAA
jgi:hypothetical protein